jgi:hypothetical protein
MAFDRFHLSLGLTMSNGSYWPFVARSLSAIMLIFAILFVVLLPIRSSRKKGKIGTAQSIHSQKELVQ